MVAVHPRGDAARQGPALYHLFAENAETEYVAYVSEQNLLPDLSGEPLRHPQIGEVLDPKGDGSYRMRGHAAH